MPMIGADRRWVNPKLSGLRVWFVKDFSEYLIFYRPFDNYVEIIRVLHSAQDRDSLLAEDESR